MGRHQLSSRDGEGFLRAFTDLWADLEHDLDVRFTFEVFRTARKGVLQLVLCAYDVPVDVPQGYRAKYTCEYPTAAVQSFEAAFYSALLHLDRQLADMQQFPEGRG